MGIREKRMETTLVGVLYGVYGDNGKENGNLGLINFRVSNLWGLKNWYLHYWGSTSLYSPFLVNPLTLNPI